MTTPFSPPLYVQRYQFVIDYVQAYRPRKVIDFGCADCRLLNKLKFHRDSIQLLVGVDINAAALLKRRRTLAPLMTDYLQPRNGPLTIELYQGSVTEREPCTRGFDLVTCVELIEHLELEELERFSEVVFGYMSPGAVIISTPNSEFNLLLPGLKGFRNYDHKFEWTRAEFQDWAHRVCGKYDYSVQFTGVGEAFGYWSDVGFCTQIGVFKRNYDRLNWSMSNTEDLEPSVYRLLHRVVYPSLCDNNIYQKTLFNEVLYEAQRLKQEWLKRQNADANNNPHVHCCESVQHGAEGSAVEQYPIYRQGSVICIPLSRVWSSPKLRELCGTLQCLREKLLDDSMMRLNADGTLLILPADEEEEEEEEEKEEEEEEEKEEEEEEEKEEEVKIASGVADDVKEDWEEELVSF